MSEPLVELGDQVKIFLGGGEGVAVHNVTICDIDLTKFSFSKTVLIGPIYSNTVIDGDMLEEIALRQGVLIERRL
jgi:hypothetical protein